MPNDYFQFKQFLIKQDKCAMKVCTDACLFGAWMAAQSPKLKAHSLLDIGTGTGLLSLMLAQKLNDVIVDAVEIDESACEQARENFHNSLWKKTLNVYNDSIQNFASITQKKYDIIICNPPFYENDLKSANKQRNLALHSDALLLEELVFIVNKLLTDDGNFFCLLPYYRTSYFEELLLKNKLRVKQKIFIKQKSKHNYFRSMFWVDKNADNFKQSEIIIMNDVHEYSQKFRKLTEDYYLNL